MIDQREITKLRRSEFGDWWVLGEKSQLVDIFRQIRVTIAARNSDQASEFGEMTGSFADRLMYALNETRTKIPELSRRSGVADSTIRNWLVTPADKKASMPSAENAADIAHALDVSLQWLIAGRGEMRTGEVVAVTKDQAASAGAALDPELLGRVVDRIAKVYREEGVRLADVDLGRLAAEKYAEVADLAGGPDEWPGFLEVVAARVRKAIRAAAADPIGVKREA